MAWLVTNLLDSFGHWHYASLSLDGLIELPKQQLITSISSPGCNWTVYIIKRRTDRNGTKKCHFVNQWKSLHSCVDAHSVCFTMVTKCLYKYWPYIVYTDQENALCNSSRPAHRFNSSLAFEFMVISRLLSHGPVVGQPKQNAPETTCNRL